jgi:hypothetical protein
MSMLGGHATCRGVSSLALSARLIAFELAAFNVRVKLVEPGYGPSTRFTQNTASRLEGLIPEAYTPLAQAVFVALTQPVAVTHASDVADAVWRAAYDASEQLRFPAGADAVWRDQSSFERFA